MDSDLALHGRAKTRGRRSLDIDDATADAVAPRNRLQSCRANSRRGSTDALKPSYPPVASVRRAFEILRTLNRLRIATVKDIHVETLLPKPTVVRMLDTLIADGYVVRDNMCGGYRVTHRVRELYSGYHGLAQIIEASRPCAIDLTNSIKWPVGIGVFDRDAMAVHFWTGTISPLVHLNTLLGRRPSLITSAMGRAFVAFCGDVERETIIRSFRADPSRDFGPEEESQYRSLLARVHDDGYALRSPQTEPRRNTTVAVPIRHEGAVLACITVSFFTTAVPKNRVAEKVLEPLRATVARIEEVYAFMSSHENDASTRPTRRDDNALASSFPI